MIIKPTGRTTGSMGHLISYLGTANDKTLAHQNPGKTKYLKAKANGDTAGMKRYKVYTRRDLMTWGNFDTSSEKTIKAECKRFMSGNRRKVQSREFVLMPSPDEHIDPNDPNSLHHFAKFVQMYIDNHFQSNFHYFVDVQADSHQNSRVHAHVAVINDVLTTGRAMPGRYYDVRHLRNDLRDTIKAYNAKYKDFSFKSPASVQSHQHTPSQLENRIIMASTGIQDNPAITSRPKFIAYLAKHHVRAVYRKGKKRTYHTHILSGGKMSAIKHVRTIKPGWKYKWTGDNDRHSYIKASRISRAVGGGFLSAGNVKTMLSNNRKLKATLKHQRQRATEQRSMAAQQQSEAQHEAEVRRTSEISSSISASASSSASVSASQSASISASSASYSASVSNSVSASTSASLSQSASASVSASISADPVNQRNKSVSVARSGASVAYSSAVLSISQSSAEALSQAKNIPIKPEWTSLTTQFSNLLAEKHSAEVSERKRVTGIMPKFSSRKAQRYAWWHYGHAIPAHCIGYDGKIPEFAVNNSDKKLITRLSGPIIDKFHAGKRWVVAEWNAGKSALDKFIERHNIKITNSWWEDPHGNFTASTGYPNHEVTERMNIENMAHEEPHSIIRGYNHVAKKFNNAWDGIKDTFRQRIIGPVMTKFSSMSNRASSASSARERVLSARNESESEARAAAADQTSQAQQTQSRAMSLIDSESKSASQSSFNQTPAGKSSIASYRAFVSSFYSTFKSTRDSQKASSSASVSNSKASWTNSVAGLDYNGWVDVKASVATDYLHNNEFYGRHVHHYEKYQDDVINSIGESRYTHYYGVDDSHDKTKAYYNPKYYKKPVKFNECASLITHDNNNSQAEDRQIARKQQQRRQQRGQNYGPHFN